MSQTDSAGIASAAASPLAHLQQIPPRLSAQVEPSDLASSAILIPGDAARIPETQILAPLTDSATLPLGGQAPHADSKLDMKAFVQAVNAAFPEPRDPVGRPIAPTRPERAVRTFIFMGEGLPHEGAIPPEEANAAETPVTGFTSYPYATPSSGDRPLVKPVLDAAASFMLDLAYDPILDGAISRQSIQDSLLPHRSLLAEHAPALTARTGTVPAACPELPQHERHLVEAVLEPAEPVARPSLPLRPAHLSPAAPPLTPSQRAHRVRPATLRDRNGQLAPITYTIQNRG